MFRGERKIYVHSKEEIDFKNILRIKWPGTVGGGRRKTVARQKEHLLITV